MRRLPLPVATVALALLAPAPALAATSFVTVGDDFFSPAQLDIAENDTVSWEWTGTVFHNLTFRSGPTEMRRVSDRVAGIAAKTFNEPGTYRYLCTNHPDTMRGTIRVAGEGGTRPPRDTTRPRIRALRADPARFCLPGVRRCRAPGTRLRFRLSEDATVLVRIKKGRGTVRRFQRGRKAGRRAISFSGRGLALGRYRAVLVARDNARNLSRRAVVRFRAVGP
jgi:plastocyanin